MGAVASGAHRVVPAARRRGGRWCHRHRRFAAECGGVDIKVAGSLSLAISLPTMLVGFARYSRDSSFSVSRANSVFVLAMAAGSVVGAYVGGRLLGVAPSKVLLPGLRFILIVSGVKIWRQIRACGR
jgi:uncharacterized membrane protein YfcA